MVQSSHPEEILLTLRDENIHFVDLWFSDITGGVKSVTIPASRMALPMASTPTTESRPAPRIHPFVLAASVGVDISLSEYHGHGLGAGRPQRHELAAQLGRELAWLYADLRISVCVAIGGGSCQEERVFVRAQPDVLYETFMEVMNTLQENGFYKVGLLNEDIE